MNRYSYLLLAMALGTSLNAMADLVVPMALVNDKGVATPIGKVLISESAYGLVFTPDLNGLPPGLHGFHVHVNPSCAPKEQDGKMVPALAAGGHFDPEHTNKHDLPWGNGHLGDLPPLYVDASGHADQPVLAPRIKDINLMRGHSLMVHAGGDNHMDMPMPLGGGGARVACGVIE